MPGPGVRLQFFVIAVALGILNIDLNNYICGHGFSFKVRYRLDSASNSHFTACTTAGDRLKRRPGQFQELYFFRRGTPTEYIVAMGVASEPVYYALVLEFIVQLGFQP